MVRELSIIFYYSSVIDQLEFVWNILSYISGLNKYETNKQTNKHAHVTES